MRQKYSLALGGGAARGLAHLGVLKYLEEQKVQIEEIAGTSMGSVIGASLALGNDVKTSIELAKRFRFWKVFDLDLSLGIAKGKRAYKFIVELFGETTFEDTIIPLRIVGVNLKTGKIQVFTTGKIADAIRASVSLPGIFKPHEIGGNMYVDGGVLCNLPIDILEGENKIGVSVLKTGEINLDTIEKNVFGFDRKKSFFTGSYEMIDRCLTLMMEQNENKSIDKAQGNIQILKPNLQSLTITDFGKVDEFVTIGYEEAKKYLKL